MFFVVGAQKAGTTMIHDWLKSEGCRLPRTKETHFFSHAEKYKMGFEWYEDQFSGVGIQGEIDPEYLYSFQAATLIKQRYPNAKIIIIFRDPIERAYSQYNMTVMRGLEKINFYDAVNGEEDRKNNNNYRAHFSYVDRSIYVPQINRFLKEFKKENVLFVKFNSMFESQNKKNEYIRLCEFIGIQAGEDTVNATSPANQASRPYFGWINKLLWDKSSFSFLRSALKIFFPTKKIRDVLGRKLDLVNRKKTAKVTIDYSRIHNKIKLEIIKDMQEMEKITSLDFSDWKMRYADNES